MYPKCNDTPSNHLANPSPSHSLPLPPQEMLRINRARFELKTLRAGGIIGWLFNRTSRKWIMLEEILLGDGAYPKCWHHWQWEITYSPSLPLVNLEILRQTDRLEVPVEKGGGGGGGGGGDRY